MYTNAIPVRQVLRGRGQKMAVSRGGFTAVAAGKR